MRYNLILAIVLFFNVQSSNAVVFTAEGMDTGQGFVSWQSVSKISTLEYKVNACIVGIVVIAGILMYIQWSKQNEEQEDVDDDEEFIKPWRRS